MNIEIKPNQLVVTKPIVRRSRSTSALCPRTRRTEGGHRWAWSVVPSTVSVWYRIERQVCQACSQPRETMLRTTCNTCGAILAADEHGIPTRRWCGCCQAGREHHESVARADI